MARRGPSMVTFAVVLAALLVGVFFHPAHVAVAEEPIVLRVLHYFDATNPGAQRELDEVWKRFEEENPDIRVIREDQFNEPFHQKVEAYAAVGQLPDVLFMWPGGRSSTLHSQRLVKDLTPLLGDMADEFLPEVLRPQAGGYLGMLPMGITSSHTLYVNKGLLDELGLEVPTTYDELVAMVPKLRAAGKDVILMGAQDDWVIQSTLFSMLVGRLLGNDYLDQLRAGTAKFTDQPFVDALRFYKRLYDDGVLDIANLQTSYGEVNGLFAAGRAPFLIDGDWKVGNFLTDPTTGQALIPPEEQHNFIMTVFPAIPGEVVSNSTSMVTGTGFGMSAAIPDGSAKEEAAWRLIKWLTSPEVQKIRLETGGAIPSRIGITSDRLEPLAQQQAVFSSRFEGTYVLDDIFPSQVYTPLNIGLQEIPLGLATPEQVAANVQRAFDNWRATQQ